MLITDLPHIPFSSPSFDSGSGDSLWRWSFRFLRRVEKEKREDQMSVWCYRVEGLLDFGGPRTVTQQDSTPQSQSVRHRESGVPYPTQQGTAGTESLFWTMESKVKIGGGD